MLSRLLSLGAVMSMALLAPVARAQDTRSTSAALAVKTVDADPALWVVKDQDTTIYLFGTVHALKPG